MWITCCASGRHKNTKRKNESESVEKVTPDGNESKSPKITVHISIAPDDQSQNAVSTTTTTSQAPNGRHIRHERQSLPDVVIPSANLSVYPYLTDQRHSLQVDTETGRRPTLEMETTARLARAESFGMDDNCVPDAVPSPQLSTQKTPLLGSFFTDVTQSSTRETELPTSEGSSTRVKQQKKSSIMRLLPIRSLHKHSVHDDKKSATKPPSPPHSDEQTQSEDQVTESTNEETGIQTPRYSKNCKEEVEESDPESPMDKLGHLPSSSRAGMSRFWTSGIDNLNCNLAQPYTSQQRGPLDPDNPNNYGCRQTSSRNPNLRRGSLCIFSHVDEPIVTPFAQILASLRRVRANFILLTNVSSSRDSRFGTTHSSLTEDQQTLCPSGAHEQFKSTATETLEELEWCLERLENIQTHRSVSDMASSKFKKLLNKELSQFTDGSRTGKQISEYICSTYLDSKEGDTNAIGTGPSEADESVNLTKSSPGVLGENVSAVSQTCPPDSLAIKSRINAHSSTAEVCTGIEPAKSALGTPNSALISSPDSTTSLPERLLPFGVESEHPQLLNKIITESLDVWGLDVFELGEMTLNPLTCVFYAVMQKRGLIKRFAIPEMNLIRYVNALESKYNVNPYHNRLHATDVLQSTHVLLNAQALSPLFTDLEVLSLLFACAIHDVDHPGLTNQYLINTNDKLAILYNDASVLENHHLAVAFSLLSQPGCDIFENLQKKQRLSLRRMTIDMVLATDMSKHMSILADLKTMVETKKVAGSGVLTLDNYSDRMQILKSMIHCSDLSNPAKPLELYRRWNARIMEENFRQGDREREQGLELSPMCDRTTASIEKSQVSFIDYIAHPLWETWADLVYPDAQKILDTIDENREWYLGQIVEEGRKASTAD